ncbi:MAG TPA: VOC family protein [Chitinophagaceae bacterium]|jgi:PhnB protein|nr:VOC family protein [Chitinophagaceae bacterium]
MESTVRKPIPSSIEPWLTVQQGEKAVSFYKAAFGATESYRMEAPDGGLVVKLTVETASFWISGDLNNDVIPAVSGIKIIITTTDPDKVFGQALIAGAAEVFPVGEDYGWRLGRITDPFGYDWEIGRPLDQ